MFMAEPMRASNSFVGTEEYIAPVCYSWTYYTLLLSSKNYGSNTYFIVLNVPIIIHIMHLRV